MLGAVHSSLTVHYKAGIQQRFQLSCQQSTWEPLWESVGHKKVFENVILYADCGNFLHCFCSIFHAVRYLNAFLSLDIKFLSM